MTRAQIRIELLRIAFAELRGDDRRAIDIAKTWEPWVLEVFDEGAEEKPKSPPTPRAKAQG